MKITGFILACLVLALSILPCNDSRAASTETIINKAISKPSHNHTGSQDDDCSPFCQCQCCSGVIIDHTTATCVFIVAQNLNLQCSYYSSDIIHVANSIWQPPRNC